MIAPLPINYHLHFLIISYRPRITEATRFGKPRSQINNIKIYLKVFCFTFEHFIIFIKRVFFNINSKYS